MALYPNDELTGEGRVRTLNEHSVRTSSLMGGETEAQRDKGRFKWDLSGVLWSSLSKHLLSRGPSSMQCVGAGMGRAPLRVTWANLGSADGSIGPWAVNSWGAARRRAWGQVPTFLGGNRLLVCVFDGP